MFRAASCSIVNAACVRQSALLRAKKTFPDQKPDVDNNAPVRVTDGALA
jgi:hypothetical protein